VTELFFPIPFTVLVLMGIEGVPSKGLLISATNPAQVSSRSRRAPSRASYSLFISNLRSVVVMAQT